MTLQKKVKKLLKYNNFIAQTLKNIQLTISDEETGTLLLKEFPKEYKGKVSFHAEKEGRYNICIQFATSWRSTHLPLFFSMKVGSENMDEPKLDLSLKKEHLDTVHDKARQILQEAKGIVDIQQIELENEDDNARHLINTTKSYYSICVLQIVFVISLGLYQVFSLRKYLSSNYLI